MKQEILQWTILWYNVSLQLGFFLKKELFITYLSCLGEYSSWQTFSKNLLTFMELLPYNFPTNDFINEKDSSLK